MARLAGRGAVRGRRCRRAKLVMAAYNYVRTYSRNLGWAYICAMLHDTTTSQHLEYRP
jgi:hypothetical protein